MYENYDIRPDEDGKGFKAYRPATKAMICSATTEEGVERLMSSMNHAYNFGFKDGTTTERNRIKNILGL